MAVEWADRRGPIGSLQEQAWLQMRSTRPITFADQVRAIKAVLRGLSDCPVRLTSRETAEDGAPSLRDQIVSRAEVLCALSRLPDPEQQRGLLLRYADNLSPLDAARLMGISERTLQRLLAEAWPRLVEMIFDYVGS